jgi:hypothetical protein
MLSHQTGASVFTTFKTQSTLLSHLVGFGWAPGVWICRCTVLTPSMSSSLSRIMSPFDGAQCTTERVTVVDGHSTIVFLLVCRLGRRLAAPSGAPDLDLSWTDGELSHLTTCPQVEEGPDYCVITPPKDGLLKEGVAIDTYDDHRMAMAFSLAACGNTSVVINDPGCTRKTFPTYFEVLSTLVK